MKITEQEAFITNALARHKFMESIEILWAGKALGVGKLQMCTKFYSVYLKGNDLYVLGVDEMVIMKLLLRMYGIGMSILCN